MLTDRYVTRPYISHTGAIKKSGSIGFVRSGARRAKLSCTSTASRLDCC
jgi:hypothetical protein